MLHVIGNLDCRLHTQALLQVSCQMLSHLLTIHRSDGSKRTPGLAQKIALDIARGLQFLHERHIVHLDLKSPNGEAAAASTGLKLGSRLQSCLQPFAKAAAPLRIWRNIHTLRAVLLTEDSVAKIGDVGLARFMPNDYMSAQAAIGENFA